MLPERIGRYIVSREIGVGGMARAFLARDPSFDRQVAIEVLAIQPISQGEFRVRFDREAKAIAALDDDHIVPVYDFGEDNGLPYIVMKYMAGGSLSGRLHQGRLPLAESLAILNRVAAALDVAHKRNIIHRDIKPGNILFDEKGRAFLSDFGVAKVLEAANRGTASSIVGTPAYMSPEQALGDQAIDGRSDIYSLGVTLYEMLTGVQPFDSQTLTPLRVMMKHVNDPVPELDTAKYNLPPALAHVLRRALAKNPQDRYSSAGEFARAAANAANHQATVPIVDQAPIPTVVAGRSRRPQLLALAGCTGLGILSIALLAGGLLLSVFLPKIGPTATPPLATSQPIVLVVTEPTLSPDPTEPPTATATQPAPETSVPTATVQPTPFAGATAIASVDKMVAVFVPDGEFLMGGALATDPLSTNVDEHPQRAIFLFVFWIDQVEVTNVQYQQCVVAGECTEPKSENYGLVEYSNHPVVGVDWFQAQSYCEWGGGRLPTEAEWEKAARGPIDAPGAARIWPWGNTTPTDQFANFDDSTGDTSAVGSYPQGASPGVLDLAGNVWEWTADWYDSAFFYTPAPTANPVGPDSGLKKVIRGGSYREDAVIIRVANRGEADPLLRVEDIGFRCVRNIPF